MNIINNNIQGKGGCRCNARHQSNINKSGCLTISNIKKPDLAIYSQLEQFSLGINPSWDNPDILTNYTNPLKLMPEASIKIRNISSVPASNALVHIFTSNFGIGTKKVLQMSQKVSLNGGQESQLLFPFSQSVLAGDQRIGIHILIEHPFDEKSINNSGSQVINSSYTSRDGRSNTFFIPILNDSPFSNEIQLQLLATDIIAGITPSNKNYAPYEQSVAELTINVPAFLAGSASNIIHRHITVVGRLSDGSVLGGFTLLLFIDN